MTGPGARRDRVLAACGAKPGSAEDYPFGDGAAVFKSYDLVVSRLTRAQRNSLPTRP